MADKKASAIQTVCILCSILKIKKTVAKVGEILHFSKNNVALQRYLANLPMPPGEGKVFQIIHNYII